MSEADELCRHIRVIEDRMERQVDDSGERLAEISDRLTEIAESTGKVADTLQEAVETLGQIAGVLRTMDEAQRALVLMMMPLFRLRP